MKALTRRMPTGVPVWLVLTAFALSAAASASLFPLTRAQGYQWNTSTRWVRDGDGNHAYRVTYMANYYWTCLYSCTLFVGQLGAWVNITQTAYSYRHIEYTLTSDAAVGEWYKPLDYTFTYYNTPYNRWFAFNEYIQGVSGYNNYVSSSTCYSQNCQLGGYKDGAYVEAALSYNSNNPWTYDWGH